MFKTITPPRGGTRPQHGAQADENRPPPPALRSPSAGSLSSLLTCTTLVEDEDRHPQTKRLQMRNAHWRGAAVPGRNITPSTTAWSSNPPSDVESRSHFNSPAQEIYSLPEAARERGYDELGILHEISNSSLRRKKKQRRVRPDLEALPNSDDIENDAKDGFSFQFASTEQTDQPSRTHESSYPSNNKSRTFSASGGVKPLRVRRNRRRSNGNDTSKYIEHLESQLAASQTQLQSLASPSTTRYQSAKLRSMESESRLLRRELSEWEAKFEARVNDQIEQHETIVAGLRAQVRSLEREGKTKDRRLKELEEDIEEKAMQVASVESANYGLERRLELMSEMLAMSPGKLNLHPGTEEEFVRKSPTRSNSLVPPLSASSQSLFPTPRKEQRSLFLQNGTRHASPTLPSYREPYDRTEWEKPAHTPQIHTSSVNVEAESSGNPVAQLSAPAFTRRKSALDQRQVDAEHIERPTRRMRRFHTGSAGPLSLILSSNTANMGQSMSAPVSSVHPPSLMIPSPVQTTTRADCDYESRTRPNLSRSSATWDPDSSYQTKSEQNTPLSKSTPLFLQIPGRSNTYELSQSNLHVLTETSPKDPVMQDPVGSTQGGNLFEELSRIKQSSRKGSAERIRSRPSEAIEYPSSPSSSSVSESGVERFDPAEASLSLCLAARSSTSRIAKPLPPPFRLISFLAFCVSNSLDRKAPTVKSFINNTWRMVALSGPILEFRWWLVKLLLGDLKKRHQRTLHERRRDRSFGICGAADTDMSLEGDGTVVRLAGLESEVDVPVPPPVHWFKFSVTLVFAVGLALMDGPGTLFASTRRRGSSPDPVRLDDNDCDYEYEN